MSARILNGARVADAIRAEARPRIEAFRARAGRAPGLAIVLVGDDAASEIYVRNKTKSGGEAGLAVKLERLPSSAAIDDVLGLIRRLNGDPAIDGILVQSPLPKALGADGSQRVFDAVDPAKDVDGFHPINVGRLAQGRPALAPCTPAGIIELLDRSGIPIAGTRAVVLGRSPIVGRPMAALLVARDATVTICHSKTPDLAAVSATADLLIAAIGRPAFVTREFVKPGATVVDVGISRLTDRARVESLFGSTPRMATFETNGSLVVGDVHPAVAEVAGALTPVPGGVGPLTIAMLLVNTVTAAERRVTV
ncbi:MAG TPA: bifunctional 5,10-methylenetetrahydrofolate dehydrogenase/5,10-methenyltetrahydrofolate cyclohydrolase [Vicinamibacterales bacterium]|nr:bifunctional 5,10-methylenetetrahydrofolate dehydrogenase/5,10-methenyltetrahydrofolate cyclohydrolase [Vicinamibacterales bacterium]